MARRGENIRKRSDGRWEGRYTIHVNGKSQCRSVYAKTYMEVREKLTLAKINATKYEMVNLEQKKDITFDIVAREWLEQVKDTRKYSTYIKYCVIYNTYIYQELGKMPVNQINSSNINGQMFFQNSDSTEKSIYCVLNQIIGYAEENYCMPKINLKRKSSKKKRETIQILSLSEQAKLLQFLYKDMDIYKLGILLCLSTGLRLGEICSLKWEDIDMGMKLLHVNRTVQRIQVNEGVTKTKLIESVPKTESSKREIPISDPLIELLSQYQDCGKYFLNGTKPMEPRTYQNKFKSYLKLAGLEDNNFHILRHTFATNCINGGADVKSISEMLGHSDVKITLNRYVHPSVDIKRNYINSLFSIYGQYMGQI